MKNGYTRKELLDAGNSLPKRGRACHHCDAIIPEFTELAETDEKRVLYLIQQNRSMMAIEELQQATGCPLSWAKVWVQHRGRPRPRENGDTPCPFCGEPLRTSLAKQCPHCFRQWHDSDE